jgi:SAM-dependent methyltransferase
MTIYGGQMISNKESSRATSTPHSENWSKNAAFWIKIIREGLDPYRAELTDNAMLTAIGPTAGQTILDAGCGEGYMSRLLAKRGARVVGVDSCAELIEAATTLNDAENLDITYAVANVGALTLPDNTFDVVVCNHVVNDLPDPAEPFHEFARVLKQGGQLSILMLHPCFYISRSAERPSTNGLDSSEYFGIRRIEQRFEVGGIKSPASVIAWIRSLESYSELLINAGFCISGIREPRPSEKLLQDPWWRSNFSQPRFLLITAEKR